MKEDILENIQKRMCRKLYGYRSHSYKETLKKANLLSLRARRIRNQLITLFKMKKDAGFKLGRLFSSQQIQKDKR